jgi:hypothetical protein
VHQADAIAPPLESGVERLPGDTRGRQSAADGPTSMFDALVLAGLLKTLAPLAGVRQGKLAAADASQGTTTGTGCGLAPIHANHESVRLLYVCFTRVGISSILWQSHGTYRLVG